jgi:hypothetical protein
MSSAATFRIKYREKWVDQVISVCHLYFKWTCGVIMQIDSSEDQVTKA